MPCTRYFHHSTTSLSNDSLRPAAATVCPALPLTARPSCNRGSPSQQRAMLITSLITAAHQAGQKEQEAAAAAPAAAGQHWAVSGGPACARVQACVHGRAGGYAVLCSRLRCAGLHAAAWEKLQQQAQVAAPAGTAGTAGCSAGCSGEVLLLHLLPACDPPLHPHLHSQARQPGSGAFRRQLDSRQPGDQRPPAPTASAGTRVGGGGSSGSARSTHQQRQRTQHPPAAWSSRRPGA